MQGYSFPFKAEDRLIELGGGDFPVIRPNVDCRQLPTVDIVADLEGPLPLESESYDGVLAKFLLEHLRIHRVKGFISEVHRILKPGGVAVIITANLLEQAKVLIEREEWNNDVIYMVFGGTPDYPSNYHRSSSSPEYAIKLFGEAGFHSITIYEWPPSKEIWGRATDMVIEARKSGARIAREL